MFDANQGLRQLLRHTAFGQATYDDTFKGTTLLPATTRVIPTSFALKRLRTCALGCLAGPDTRLDLHFLLWQGRLPKLMRQYNKFAPVSQTSLQNASPALLPCRGSAGRPAPSS